MLSNVYDTYASPKTAADPLTQINNADPSMSIAYETKEREVAVDDPGFLWIGYMLDTHASHSKPPIFGPHLPEEPSHN